MAEKNITPLVTLKREELLVGSSYETNVKDLVIIKEINEITGKMKLYNATESCHQWVNIANHRLIKKLR